MSLKEVLIMEEDLPTKIKDTILTGHQSLIEQEIMIGLQEALLNLRDIKMKHAKEAIQDSVNRISMQATGHLNLPLTHKKASYFY